MLSWKLYKICICLVTSLGFFSRCEFISADTFSKIFDAIKYTENSTFLDVHLSVADFKAQNLL